MLRCLVWLLATTTPALALAATGEGTGAPLSWSADGRWVAYTATTPRNGATSPAGWLYNRKENEGDGSIDPSTAVTGTSRIVAVDAETGAGIVLYESATPLTSPAWSPDGKALAFGRVVDDPKGPARLELILQDAPGRNRVVTRQVLDADPPASRAEWAASCPAWSPDGRYLAIPDARPGRGICVVTVESGRRLKAWEGTLPAWSPDGTRLAFVRNEETATLFVVDLAVDPADRTGGAPAGLTFGPPRPLLGLGRCTQAPVWSRDGKTVSVAAQRAVVGRLVPLLQVDLLRIRVDTGSVERAAHLNGDPDQPPRGVCLSEDHDQDELFYALNMAEPPATIVWFRPRNEETVDRFNPVDFQVRVAALAFSPDGKTLAIRFGDEVAGDTAALFDVSTRKLRLVAFDRATRRDWIERLLATARTLLEKHLPPVAVEGRAVARPTILPVPGEGPANREVVLRLQRLGRLGRPLCDPAPAEAPGNPSPADLAALDEARLFFDALREAYSAALTALRSLESRTASSEDRERLLAVRAQLFLGLGDVERAGETIRFLSTLEETQRSRVEDTPAGTIMTREPAATSGWAHYLAARLDDLAKSGNVDGMSLATPPPGPVEPLVPQAPFVPNLPFDRFPPNGIIVIPQNPGPNIIRRLPPMGNGGVNRPPFPIVRPRPRIGVPVRPLPRPRPFVPER